MGAIKEKLALLPENPGVYVMLDKDGVVIYVGKARVLKNRVRQYLHASEKPEKVAAMVEQIDDFYYIITQTEIDALALENNLIKKYKPKYNILLKDDKTYPYIKVDIKEDFPRFSVTRKLKKGAKYFGPFMGGVLGVIMYVCRLFPIDNVSLFGISPNVFNIILIVVIVQALDQVLKPLILSQSVELPGILVFLGIIAGGKLFGFLGMVFAIPVIAVFKIIFGTLYKQLVGFGFLSSKIVSVVTVTEKDE